MMEINMDWNVICRICLQDGDMVSLFSSDSDSNLMLSEKVLQCTNIDMKEDSNLPDQICSNCILDLEAAYRFRMNCESSDAILQSYLVTLHNEEHIVEEENNSANELEENVDVDDGIIIKEEHNEDEYTEEIGYFDNEDIIDYKEHSENESNDEFLIKKEKDSDNVIEEQVEGDNVVKIVNESVITTMKKVPFVQKAKTVKTVKKQGKERKPTVDNIVTKHAADGTSETVIRMKRDLKSQKPLIICDICGNTYRYKHALETHMRRHRGEKPFACEECGRAFVVLFELKRHFRTHTGQKPYACKFCDRKFSDFGSRIKHERTHTGERPYICATCGKGFAYSHVLSSHVLTHTGEKRYACTECGKKFTKSHHLKAHMNTHYKTTSRKTNSSTATTTKVTGNNYSNVEVIKQNQLSMIASDTDCTYELIELKDGDEQLLNAVAVLTQSQHEHNEEEIQITEEMEEDNQEEDNIIENYDDGTSIELNISD